MEWLTDEILYYGGLILAAAAIIALLICLCISVAAKGKLKMKLRDEYGDIREIRKY